MDNIVLLPLEGVNFAGKTIALTALRGDVENLMGSCGKSVENSLYYFGSELRFDFAGDGRLEFIEFLGGADGKLRPEIYRKSVFDTDADELFAILSEKNCGDIADTENGYSYAFLNITVGVFRERLPEEVREMMEEAEKCGAPMSAKEIEAEMRMAECWSTIGMGTEGYYG